MPDATVTPGSVLTTSATEICTRTWTAEHKNIPYAVQNKVSNLYGVIAGQGTTLHLDQLIPASLGGDATTRNVWPQPMSQTMTKNVLEARLRRLVCSGSLSLSTAQQAMADDWPAALERYPQS